VPRQRRPSQNWPWGPKLPQMQNLGGGFVVRGLKLLLSLYSIFIWQENKVKNILKVIF